MSKVLYIKADIKNEGESRTFKVSDKFVEEYKKNNPKDEVIVLDLYEEGIDFLRPDDLGKLFALKDEESKNNPILKYAYQFAEADKYIIAAPMWNLSIPAILKDYIDYISVTGIAFKYTAEGPVGLCKASKALIVSGRGGDYSNPITKELEMGERYLRTILGFFGITDIETISLENMGVIGADVQGKINEAIKRASLIAENF